MLIADYGGWGGILSIKLLQYLYSQSYWEWVIRDLAINTDEKAKVL